MWKTARFYLHNDPNHVSEAALFEAAPSRDDSKKARDGKANTHTHEGKDSASDDGISALRSLVALIRCHIT